MAQYILPKNWRDFQHYKDRNPPWIRLHRSLLDNKDFHRLPVESRALAPMLWLLASESVGGRVNADADDLAFRLRTTERAITQALKPLLDKGFFVLEQDDSDALADCGQPAVPETEALQSTEAEASSEISAEPLCDSPPPLVLIPLVGGSEHPVMASDVSDWSDAYPAIDVLQQVKAMRAWAIANPKNQKTAAGVRRFITAWLAKAQDKAPPPGRHGFKRVEAEPAWRTEQRDRMAQVVGPHAAKRTETTLELIDGNTVLKLG